MPVVERGAPQAVSDSQRCFLHPACLQLPSTRDGLRDVGTAFIRAALDEVASALIQSWGADEHSLD